MKKQKDQNLIGEKKDVRLQGLGPPKMSWRLQRNFLGFGIELPYKVVNALYRALSGEGICLNLVLSGFCKTMIPRTKIHLSSVAASSLYFASFSFTDAAAQQK